ncbi:MAG TPA: CoA-binding protein [Tissierellaceae bacterium]|nr:CoA-binding protein [Tissierellaceae bacterium]
MDFKKIKEEMLNMKSWAVVGTTINKDKFGYKIWKKLKEHNYNTYGVNPNYEKIDGEIIYHSLNDIPNKIDVVDIVVPPKVSINILEEIKELGIEYVFFQPGTYDDTVVKKADELGLKYLTDDCIYSTLVEKE